MKEGFTFQYWALDGEKFDFGTPITSDITLEAVWKANASTDTPNPPTGENSQIVLWMILMLASLGGAFSTVLYSRKKRQVR